jgi:hypothetical protein
LGVIELDKVRNHFNGFPILRKSRTCGLKTIEMVPGATDSADPQSEGWGE